MVHLPAWNRTHHLWLGQVQVSRAEAISAGFIGQFTAPEIRRIAFWFLIFGPLLMRAGHVAIHASATGDLELLKILGIYSLVMALIGVTAFPKSPLLVAATAC